MTAEQLEDRARRLRQLWYQTDLEASSAFRRAAQFRKVASQLLARKNAADAKAEEAWIKEKGIGQ